MFFILIVFLGNHPFSFERTLNQNILDYVNSIELNIIIHGFDNLFDNYEEIGFIIKQESLYKKEIESELYNILKKYDIKHSPSGKELGIKIFIKSENKCGENYFIYSVTILDSINNYKIIEAWGDLCNKDEVLAKIKNEILKYFENLAKIKKQKMQINKLNKQVKLEGNAKYFLPAKLQN